MALAGIAVLAFALRAFDRNWDSGMHLHPDERHIALVAAAVSWPSGIGQYFDSKLSPLNPYQHVDSFVYGTFPLFANKGLAALTGGDQGYNSNLSGRLLAAIFDTGTVLLTFALGRRLFGRRTGLLAALLLAVTVLHIQHAHFFVSEPFLVFFVVAALYGAVAVVEKGSTAAYLLTGVAIGFAASVKINSLLLILPALVAIWLHVMSLPGVSGWRRGVLAAGRLLSLLLAGFVVFRLFNPYAFSGPGVLGIAPDHRFFDDIRRELEIQSGAEIPPNFNWVGRMPLVYPLGNLIAWGLGIPITLALCAGVYQLVRRRQWRTQPELLILATWIVTMVVLVARNFNVTMRYLLPIYPLLALGAAYGISALWYCGTRSRKLALAGRLAAAGLVALAGLWALAFVNGVYRGEHTRVAASRWIDENVQEGALLLNEAWDDTLPLGVEEVHVDAYRHETLDVYEPDSIAKVSQLIEELDRSDYILQSSQRASASIPRVPARFPSTIRYFEALAAGKLGFEQVATFRRPPRLAGVSVDDLRSDEAFTVYDHPPVTIWRKTPEYTHELAVRLLRPVQAGAALAIPPANGNKNGSQLLPSEYRAQQRSGTFADVFDAGGVSSHTPWLWWLLWLEVAGLAVLPWVSAVCRRLGDRGYGLSKLLGLVAVVWPLFLLVSLTDVPFGRGPSWAALGTSLAVGGVVLAVRRRSFIDDLRTSWRSWVAAEALFLVVFLAFCAVRAANPDLWHQYRGGEKPMELAYFTAITRSSNSPAYDPWFAGGRMNYYYLGWLFMAVPARALRMLPEIALNLGTPTFAALAGVTAFSAGLNLVALSRVKRNEGGRFGPLAAGLVAAGLLVVASNLDGVRQLFSALGNANRWVLGEVPVVGPLIAPIGGLFQVVVSGATLGQFDWWRSSRVYSESIAITEFPLWSYVFGDVHPHVMGIPFLGSVIVLALAYMATARRTDRGRRLAIAALLGAMTGIIRGVHTWDFPTAVLLAAGAIGGAALLPSELDRTNRLRAAGRDAAVALAVHVAIAYPFVATFEIFNNGVVPAPERTRPADYFLHLGIFLAITAAFVGVWLLDLRRDGLLRFSRRRALVLIGGVAVASILAAAGWSAVAGSVVASMIVATLLVAEARSPDSDLGRLAAGALILLAIVIGAAVDVVTVRDDIERMNTVFKFLLEVWQLHAVAGAFAVWYVARSVLRATGDRARLLRAASAALGCALLVAMFPFAIGGTRARLHDRFAITAPALDGLAYLRERPAVTEPNGAVIQLADDQPLIRWLRTSVEGSPTIVEAPGPLYTWTSRISVMTGLPTVIGWDWHQTQQRLRYADAVRRRVDEATAFYRSADSREALRFLARYDVSYVVVGGLERARGTAEGLAKIAALPVLEEVFRSPRGASIYEVDKSLLASEIPRLMNIHSS